MSSKRRGRPTGQKKTQLNIRLPEKISGLLNSEGKTGVLCAFLKKAYPAGWSYIDPPETVEKKDRLDYTPRSKRTAYGWTNSNMIMYLLDDMMRCACREMPDVVLSYSMDRRIAIAYVELALKYKNLKEEKE